MSFIPPGFGATPEADTARIRKEGKGVYRAMAGMQWDKFKSSKYYEPTRYFGGQGLATVGAGALGALTINRKKDGSVDWVGAGASGAIGMGLFEINEFRKGTQFNGATNAASIIGEKLNKPELASHLKQSIFSSPGRTAAIAGITAGSIGAIKGGLAFRDTDKGESFNWAGAGASTLVLGGLGAVFGKMGFKNIK